jgi:Sec-independent protein translocase protein TatA
MSFSGMVFLMLLGLIIFGPKKLPRVGGQIAKVLAELKSFAGNFQSQLDIEIDAARAKETIPPASSPQSRLLSETGPRVLENDAFESEPGRGEALRG